MAIKETIDAVITWVDGNDRVYAEKLAHYCAQLGIKRTEGAAPTRFNERGELTYCVMSLLRFAPWLKTIFIVTDQQTPPIIKQLQGTPHAEKVKLIDHREIFSGLESYLPTFNSLSIESVLWRIKGISNQFIYLNDDFSLIRPVSPHDFFQGGKLVLRGEWKIQQKQKWHYKLKHYLLGKTAQTLESNNLHRTVQERSAQLAGLNKHFFHLPHAPYPARKDIFANFFQENPQQLSDNLSYRLRDYKQFWPISLAQHLEIQKKNVVFDSSLEVVTINGACHSLAKIKSRLARAERKKNVPFICLQSIDEASELTQKLLFNWLDQKIMA
ncbi:stealth family protein [Legionella sp.]